MPARSEAQRRLAGADLRRKRAGKETRTDMTEEQLADYARKPTTKDAARALQGRRKADY